MSDKNKKEFKIIRDSYYGVKVSIPIEELTNDQLIKLCKYQFELIDDYKNHDKDKELRNRVLELERLEDMYGYQVDKIIGILSNHGLGDYNQSSLYGKGKSPINGVVELSLKLNNAQRKIQTLESASAVDFNSSAP